VPYWLRIDLESIPIEPALDNPSEGRGKTMNWLDPVGASLSLICTYYFTTTKRFAWLIGILAVALNICLYWQKGIYGTLALECIYFVSMIYGWCQWSTSKKDKNQHHLSIRYLNFPQLFILSLVACLGIIFLSQGLKLWTDSDVPYWDASVTVLSLIAQGLLCFKIIHCWVLWFIVDALAASMQLYKKLPFHSAIHWLYLVLAVMGYFRWRKLSYDQTVQVAFR
jgi:nicotinamide mononucleotide transporter